MNAPLRPAANAVQAIHPDQAWLIQQAQAVLRGNWMGYATKPAPRLYPHQWSWDAAFIAIGYAHFDQDRAAQELRSLFHGQWANGLLPHIVFNPAVTDYTPGPEFWRTDRSPHAPHAVRTSGIVQPPLHATAIWHIYQVAQDKERARGFLREMFPRLVAWHTYLYRERDMRVDGLVYLRHPWESGQDNSPIWDRLLARITLRPDRVLPYRRVDSRIVDAAERPSDAEYDRYAYLVRLAWENDYDEARIRAVSPFLVEDVLFNALLVQANHDLGRIAREIGEDGSTFEAWAARTAGAMNARQWNDEHGIYFDHDLAMHAPIHAHVAAGFSPLFAGVPNDAQVRRMLDKLNACGFCPLDATCWAVPSFDKQEPGYSSNRYWRGPVWINVNWLLYRGLRRYGFDDYAAHVRQAIVELPRRCGFYEYFDPDTGQGHGSDNFSWTAALLLDVLLEESDEARKTDGA